MSYRIRVINSKGQEFQIFNNNALPDEFIEYVDKHNISHNQYNFGGCVDDFKEWPISDIQELIDLVDDVNLKFIHEHNLQTLIFPTGLVDIGNFPLHRAAATAGSESVFFESLMLIFWLIESGDTYRNSGTVHLTDKANVTLAAY